MSQPRWKFLANLGDAHPLDHGGLFVYEDLTGVYGCEMERVEPLSDADDSKIEVRRVLLDRLKEVRKDDRVYLVPFIYEESWCHPVSAYVEWFADKLLGIAGYVGSTEAELRERLCSDDGLERAEAYRAIYDHEGWANGDDYPLTLTRGEAKRRYRRELGGVKALIREYRGVRYLSKQATKHEHGVPWNWTTCGTCGRAWDDTKSTDITPTPGGRCPFEHWHTKKEMNNGKV